MRNARHPWWQTFRAPALETETDVSALVIGLGNPGEEYAATRHNVGQMVVEELARRGSAALSVHKKTRTRSATVRLAGQPVVLGVPMSYMNLSGGPVSAL